LFISFLLGTYFFNEFAGRRSSGEKAGPGDPLER
jgi:hypothetical protein